MNSKMKELPIDASVQSIPLEELAKEVKGVTFGHCKVGIADPKALEDLLKRLPKKPDLSSMFCNKGGKS